MFSVYIQLRRTRLKVENEKVAEDGSINGSMIITHI